MQTPNKQLNELHLFAGIGGGILGGMLLGHTTVCAVEIEEYPRQILLQRQRDGLFPRRFPIWDDVQTFDGRPWRGKVDVVCGGFPCQDISIANPNGEGIDGSRSGLWEEMARIVGEVRPQFVFVENSSQLVGRGLTRVISDLAKMGYDSSWCCLGGHAAGYCSNGERLWLLAHESDGNGRQTPTIPSEITNQEEPRRRQFERAISETISCQAHTGLRGNPAMFTEWMDSIKAVGNSQNPAVAKLAWETLTSEES